MDKLELTFENDNNKVSHILESYVSNNSVRVVTDGIANDGDQTLYLFPELIFTNNLPLNKDFLIKLFAEIATNADNQEIVQKCLLQLTDYCEAIDFSPMGEHRKILDYLRPNTGNQGAHANFYDRNGHFCLYGDEQLLAEGYQFSGKVVFYN